MQQPWKPDTEVAPDSSTVADPMVTPKPARGRGRLQSRRARLALALGAGIMALLCLGGVGVFIALYDEATEIDRSAPDIATDSFLIAFLVNRDDQQAKLYTCENPDLAAITGLRQEMIRREEEFSVSVAVSWGALIRVPMSQGKEDVSTDLTISSSSNGKLNSSRNEEWVFNVVDQDGSWRVCGSSKLS